MTKALATLAILATLTACSKGDQASSDSTAATSGAAPSTISGTAGPDQEFLTKMTDHHEGMVQMAMAAMTKAAKPATQTDAHNLHTKQAAERDSMAAMLKTSYSVDHTPAVMPENKAMMDSLNARTGAAYDAEFYRQTIKHHEEGIRMIDRYLPQLTNAQLKAMGEKMKADQQKEIAEFQPKAKPAP
jgi:uncharacterized protein (DUF305 family)